MDFEWSRDQQALYDRALSFAREQLNPKTPQPHPKFSRELWRRAGEFGFLAELSGAVALPGGDRPIDEPYLSTAFRVVRPDGAVSRSGYRIRVFLPDATGQAIAEPGPSPGTPAAKSRDPRLAALEGGPR